MVNLTFGLRVARGSSHGVACRHRERGYLIDFHTGYKEQRGGLSLQFAHAGFNLPHVQNLGRTERIWADIDR